jgi:hypothetical protein
MMFSLMLWHVMNSFAMLLGVTILFCNASYLPVTGELSGR